MVQGRCVPEIGPRQTKIKMSRVKNGTQSDSRGQAVGAGLSRPTGQASKTVNRLQRPVVNNPVESIPSMTIHNTSEISFHPGSFVRELLVWQGISPDEFSDITGVPEYQITELIEKRRAIDIPISRVLAAYFSNSAKFWLDLQQRFDRRNQESADTRDWTGF